MLCVVVGCCCVLSVGGSFVVCCWRFGVGGCLLLFLMCGSLCVVWCCSVRCRLRWSCIVCRLLLFGVCGGSLVGVLRLPRSVVCCVLFNGVKCSLLVVGRSSCVVCCLVFAVW